MCNYFNRIKNLFSMKKQVIAAMLLLSVGVVKLQAQNFPGYRTGNYTGVNGVFFNPASIADSRYRWDVNLFSANGFVGNDRGSFKLKDLTSANSTTFKNNFLGGTGNTNANINAEILGPSVMFNLTRKSAMAFTTRTRVIANLKDFDGNLINSVINSSNSNYPYSINSNSNSRLITNGWSEFGVSYAREIASSGPHYLKGGVTLKYLSGAGNNYLQINQINTTLNLDVANRAYLQNASGGIGIGNSGADLDNLKFNNLFNGNGGIGGDIGLVYEYRPKYPDAGSDAQNRDVNKYKLKVGLSLLDIGSIRYTENPNNSASYNMHITGNNRFYLDQLKDKGLTEIKAVLDANPTSFTNTLKAVSPHNSNLPTVLQGDVDYHFNRGFFISLGGQLNLVNKSSFYSANQYNSFTITPRYEGKSFGLYFPVNYNELTQFNAGISLRAGPLFIGSGSLFSAIAKSKQADLHIGLRIGILQKAKKEGSVKKTAPIAAPAVAVPVVVVPSDKDGDGINDMEDKCPDVAGIAKYQGCPIPDTDGDGINDEVDKCPAVKGLVKYQGCPIPDTDGDGINDEEDKCPTVAGTAKYQGCPIPDSDGDGINDEEDKCPTLVGLPINMGCPAIEKAIKDKINFAASRIFFSPGSTKLLAKSFKSLDGVATLLKADRSFKMDIDGYTDNKGKTEINLALSEKRAASVKAYLVSKGVTESNLISTGHGMEKPVASNKTAAGRAKNRRVELNVRNY